MENVPLIEQETHRLAIVNMDWNQVKVNYCAFELRMEVFSYLCHPEVHLHF